jgi:hypothetical protein
MIRAPKVPDSLVSAGDENRLVLFAGAGLSSGLVDVDNTITFQRLPNWSQLVVDLLSRAHEEKQLSTGERRQLLAAIKQGKHLFASETVRQRMGERLFKEVLRDIFRNPKLRPTVRHELISDIPFSAIITTNYDKLIESANTGVLPPTYTFDDGPQIISALAKNQFFVLKAHGDIDQERVILTERDYRDLVYR